MDTLNSRVLQPVAGVFENKTVTVVASMLLALYAGLAAPALPNTVIQFFDSTIGRFIHLFNRFRLFPERSGCPHDRCWLRPYTSHPQPALC